MLLSRNSDCKGTKFILNVEIFFAYFRSKQQIIASFTIKKDT